MKKINLKKKRLKPLQRMRIMLLFLLQNY